jgi:serine/threonine-protein kinase
MAYVNGQTLQQKLRQRGQAFAWPQVLEWARPLCAVLSYLHTQTPPILFRDLKPSNIMVEDSGRLRLIDFGIARTSHDGEKTSTFLRGTGTSGFSPIEQYGGGQSTDHRSDIYSLGATLYQLLTGRVPPDAVSRISQGAAVVEPSQLNADLPAALDPILLRSLALNKQDRQQSVAEMAAELEAVALSDEESATEDLRPAALAAAPSASSPQMAPPRASSAPPLTSGSPNITVELVPSRPAASPLQLATGLGVAAVVTLLLGLLLIPKTPPAASAATATPDSSVAYGQGHAATAQSASSPAPRSEVASPSHHTGSGSAPAYQPRDSAALAGDRIRRPRVAPVSRVAPAPARAQPESLPQAVQEAPSTAPRPHVASVAAKLPESYPRAASRPASESSHPHPSQAPSEQPGAEPAPPVSAAQSRPPRPEEMGFPPVPEGMPEPLRDAQGRPLPPDMQRFPPRGGRPRAGNGPPDEGPPPSEGVPGYDTGHRRH